MKQNWLNYLLSGFRNMLPSTDENWKIITLCLLGATIFWFFNALNKEYTARIKYPVEFVYDSNETVVVDPLPQDVRIEVRGGGWNLLRKTFWFNVNPVFITLNEPTETKFLTSRNLKPVFIDQIAEIRIDEVLVDTLRLNIEKKITKSLPVVVDSSSIRMAPDYRIVSPIRLSQDSIQVTGPTSRVNSLGNSIILSLQSEELNRDYNDNFNISAYLPAKVTSSPSVININFDVQQFLHVDKPLTVQPVNFPDNVALKDTVVNASVYLARNNVERLDTSKFRVVADYRRINRRDSTISLRLMEYPDFISNVSLESETIGVTYEE